jgi:hypothetical protein
MFTEVTALIKVYLHILKERGILEKELHGKELRSILHLYFLLDEICEASNEHLHLARHGTSPDVAAELESMDSSPSEEMERQLALIAHNVTRFCEQIDSLQKRLGIYVPEIPRTVRLRRFSKSALVQWWIKVLDDRDDFVPEKLVERLQLVVPETAAPQFPIRDGYLNIIIYAGSINPEYLSTRNAAAISAGESNVLALEKLRDELREFLREKCDLREVF